MPVPADKAPHCEQVLWSVLFSLSELIFRSEEAILVGT
jgi:hypothetical protein